MCEGDHLVSGACATPSDATARLVLADWLQENPPWGELEELMRGDRGVRILSQCKKRAGQLKRTPCLKLLWAEAIYVGKGFVLDFSLSRPMGDFFALSGFLMPASGISPFFHSSGMNYEDP
jgi:uncharacterized protein (TIGR02996 family)